VSDTYTIDVVENSELDINIRKGSTLSITANVKDSDDNALALQSHTGVAVVKGRYLNTSFLGQFEVDFTTPESGVITLTLSGSKSSNMPVTKALYELEITDSGTLETHKYLRGEANIYPQLNI
jgi:hypothetical protein